MSWLNVKYTLSFQGKCGSLGVGQEMLGPILESQLLGLVSQAGGLVFFGGFFLLLIWSFSFLCCVVIRLLKRDLHSEPVR